jgi:hypothetical protein
MLLSRLLHLSPEDSSLNPSADYLLTGWALLVGK